MNYQPQILGILESNSIPAPLKYFIAAQAAHESANFTSSVFKDCNNSFGYSNVRGACPGHERYQKYNSVNESVLEVVAWIKRRQAEGKFPANLATITTPEQYAQLLKNSNYYEDSVSNYASGIRRFLNENISSIVGGGSLLLLLVGSFFLLRILNKS